MKKIKNNNNTTSFLDKELKVKEHYSKIKNILPNLDDFEQIKWIYLTYSDSEWNTLYEKYIITAYDLLKL